MKKIPEARRDPGYSFLSIDRAGAGMATSIIIDPAACKFSAAHFLAGHPKCSRLHGHNYHVRVKLSGELDGKGPYSHGAWGITHMTP